MSSPHSEKSESRIRAVHQKSGEVVHVAAILDCVPTATQLRASTATLITFITKRPLHVEKCSALCYWRIDTTIACIIWRRLTRRINNMTAISAFLFCITGDIVDAKPIVQPFAIDVHKRVIGIP